MEASEFEAVLAPLHPNVGARRGVQLGLSRLGQSTAHQLGGDTFQNRAAHLGCASVISAFVNEADMWVVHGPPGRTPGREGSRVERAAIQRRRPRAS
jgi:hypothetical protein